METSARLAFDCRVLVLFTHADVQKQTHMRSYAALGLQVCILLWAAKALCGFLESRFFGGRNVCRRRRLLVIGVRFSYWWGLWRPAAVRRRSRRVWGWRRRIYGEGVRVLDLLYDWGLLEALFLLALPLLFALVQRLGRLGDLEHYGGVLLQVLAPGRLGQQDDAGAVHPRGRLEVQLAAVFPPALQLGVMLSLDIPRRHWHFQDLREGRKKIKKIKNDIIRKLWGNKTWKSPRWKINPFHVRPLVLELWTSPLSVNAKGDRAAEDNRSPTVQTALHMRGFIVRGDRGFYTARYMNRHYPYCTRLNTSVSCQFTVVDFQTQRENSSLNLWHNFVFVQLHTHNETQLLARVCQCKKPNEPCFTD